VKNLKPFKTKRRDVLYSFGVEYKIVFIWLLFL